MEPAEIAKLITQVLSADESMSFQQLHHACAAQARMAIGEQQMRAAIRMRIRQQHLLENGQTYRRTQPDSSEQSLEAPTLEWLANEEAQAALNYDPDASVLQRTAQGGTSGTGRWSRPDFLLATIRRRRFDPWRHLDVISFELKNRAGTDLMAVHEALAHARFAHYAYVVCPRDKLTKRNNEALADECARHRIGLIQFNLTVPQTGPALRNWALVQRAERHDPDPDIVERFLGDRLSEEKQVRLEQIAAKSRSVE
ncbi:MAG: hypothetical protein MRY63_13360 [Neomegalonema sp.]|nr:hypothetical protein [Neomegalonema sp.]